MYLPYREELFLQNPRDPTEYLLQSEDDWESSRGFYAYNPPGFSDTFEEEADAMTEALGAEEGAQTTEKQVSEEGAAITEEQMPQEEPEMPPIEQISKKRTKRSKYSQAQAPPKFFKA